VDLKTEALYYDINVPYLCLETLDNESYNYIKTRDAISKACMLLDLRDFHSESYYEGIDKASKYLKNEFYGKICGNSESTISCIGHTHIDVAWLWTLAQTKEKAQRSFSTVINLLDRYDDYIFLSSQPQLYQYVKKNAPEIYAQIKERIAEGRWEPEGGMFVEADCNLASGEALVRQFLYGKRFFKQEFGKDNLILWLPDVFGYSAALPQIMDKCGIRHFVTSKISWNESNTLPVDCFLWQGIDGTEIFTNFITTQTYTGMEATRGTTYVGMNTPAEIKGTWNKFLQKEYANRALNTYGHGDGGGGPTKKMLEYQRRMAKGLPGMPVTRTETLLNHLDDLRKEFDAGCIKTRRTPKWVGELHLEYHRGTYTSIAKVKRGNRKS
jgi:alpha-mannosidase